MSTPVCPACHGGICKRHPLQDHGRTILGKGPKGMSRKQVVAGIYESTVAKRLERLRASAASKMDAVADSAVSVEERHNPSAIITPSNVHARPNLVRLTQGRRCCAHRSPPLG
ncbi:hypothetical protein FNF31_02362 [Cafeteria roenbergensis]|uniref:Uncharacterized protein n=1 Tax=Cafeteria roenbergensis TaxID=33653 RepID=A0A5A8DGK5_CAFRO|nr:hypothetical protein FNF31_02362 [Cafeteria roenbergensis]KAA0170086.1 hypothetical protein FNF28_01695 [Cafeteria roenbergensis]